MTLNFKQQYTLEQRLHKINRIFERYPDRVPIVVEKINPRGSEKLYADPILLGEKKIFLVRCEVTICQFSLILRQKIQLTPEKGLFLFIGGAIPSNSSILGDLYHQNKDLEDNFLYVTYSGENTFGNMASDDLAVYTDEGGPWSKAV